MMTQVLKYDDDSSDDDSSDDDSVGTIIGVAGGVNDRNTRRCFN